MICRLIVLNLFFPAIVFASKNSITITVKYREAANTFVIMDCVSGWWNKTFCQDEDGAYQKYWIEHFGLSENEKGIFKQYDMVRKKYYKGLGLPKDDTGPFKDGLFARKSGIAEDQIAPSFYDSDNLDQAFQKLEKKVSSEDLAFLKGFYAHFQPKYEVLLKESEPFKKKTIELSKRIKKKNFAKFFSKVTRYYSVNEGMDYRVLYTWYPPLDRDAATPIDNFLVFQQNPIKHIKTVDEDVIFHEIIHTISARQPQKQKEDISEAFLKSCSQVNDKDFGRYNGRILEEPLAVAIGQIIFLKEYYPERLKFDSKLYNNPWISSFAKLIHPIIEQDLNDGIRFSEVTARKFGFVCDELFQATSFMENAPKEPRK